VYTNQERGSSAHDTRRVTIIRRKRNRAYTVIGNRPMNDDRLSTSALGVLCYLLSRPDDWIVRPSQLKVRFDCGRDHMQTCLRELIEAGYITHERTGNLAGEYAGGEYVVYDEPVEAGAPQSGNPVVENPLADEPAKDNRPLLSTDSGQSTNHHQPARASARERHPAFEEFFRVYPKRGGRNPKHPAEQQFAAAVKAGADPAMVIAAAAAYRDEMRAAGKLGTPYVAQAKTWLSQKSWVDYAEEVASRARAREAAAAKVFVEVGTPAWEAWQRYSREVLGRTGSPQTERRIDDRTVMGWSFDSEHPPALPAPIAVNSSDAHAA
jgi:hypothetical protein